MDNANDNVNGKGIGDGDGYGTCSGSGNGNGTDKDNDNDNGPAWYVEVCYVDEAEITATAKFWGNRGRDSFSHFVFRLGNKSNNCKVSPSFSL